MKYTCEITINQSIQKVIELFDNPDNLKHWQPGLKSFEHLEGTPGQPGAKSKLLFDMNGRQIEMIETITVRNLPAEFSGTYDAKGVHNISKNYFSPAGDNATKYVNENEFQLSGFMKVIGLLFGGSFKKQSQQYLEHFKAFAENGTSVAAPAPAPEAPKA